VRIVADTSVLVSAIIFGGSPEDVLLLVRSGSVRLVISSATLDELRRVLRIQFRFTDEAAFRAETLLRAIADIVEPEETVADISDDPEDNRVLAAATVGHTDFIVSGDRHLLRLTSFRGIPIVTVRRLLDYLAKRAPDQI
jgi:putative PIN family toxin of toxin-antitoxin system